MTLLMKKRILSCYSLVILVYVSNAQQDLAHAKLSEMGFNETLVNHKVDSIVALGIKEQAFPGAQILVAKDGKVVFHKAFGFHTYDSVQKVGLDDIYDLASVTKIIGPLPALMKLVDEKKLDLDAPFSTYWKPWAKRKDKKDLTLRQILSHQAGLVPYIVFLERVMKNDKIKKRFIRNKPSKRFQKQAYHNLYVSNRFSQKMHRTINRSEVSEEKKYRYSGLTFLVFPELIEQLTGVDYETYVTETFYKPLGSLTLVFSPSKKGYPNKIVPTELDTVFRKAVVQGWVHDENASLRGGVSGNAGLFATADDLAKMLLFYQNYGIEGGTQIISAETVKEFARIQYPENENRRGLGFDKPLIGNDTLSLKDAYPAPSASKTSFGHAGFTGTFVWADPENQLVFIFLSNRVYPSREHRNLYKLNIRTALQQVFYDALVNSKK